MSKGLMNNGLTTSEEEYYFTKGYQQGRADMLTEIKAKARKYHRGKSEPVQFVIYDNELEQLKTEDGGKE